MNSKRIWKETLPPAYMHEQLGIYNGEWMPQMDRCWMSDDGFEVVSRLLITDWGKVEHAAIIKAQGFTSSGESDLPWAVKMQIKNELFGRDRLGVEVFPKTKNLVDVMDVYHLWIFPKDFDLPFGIHPVRDKKARWVKRGVPHNVNSLVENSKDMLDMIKDSGKPDQALS